MSKQLFIIVPVKVYFIPHQTKNERHNNASDVEKKERESHWI